MELLEFLRNITFWQWFGIFLMFEIFTNIETLGLIIFINILIHWIL